MDQRATANDIARREGDLATWVAEIELVAEIGRAAATSEDIPDLLRRVLERLRDVVDFKGGSIALLDDDERLEIVAAIGVIDDAARAVRLRKGEGIAGTVVASGRPFSSGDIDRERRVEVAARDVGTNRLIRSYLCVPLIARGHVIGTLQIDSAEPDAFGDPEQRLLETVATQVAGVVAMAHLAQREHAARLARDEFLSIVSHDLRNPITVIRGQVQLLLRRDPDRPDAPALRTILQQTSRLDRMVSGLGDVARGITAPLELERQPGDLAAIAERAAALALSDDQRGRVSVDAEGPIHGQWDHERLERAIVNLVENAAKYSPAGSPILVRVHGREGTATIDVVDEGPGITPEEERTLFERFVRGHHAGATKGLGLGLYIVRLVAEAHGGHASAATRADGVVGSVFRIELPIVR